MALNSASKRVAGLLYCSINGVTLPAKGNFTVGMGTPKRTEVIGSDGIHGYKEEAQAPFIEGTITNRAGLNVKQLLTAEDATITLQLPGGKTYVLREAWQAGDGNINMDEGEISVKFVGMSMDET